MKRSRINRVMAEADQMIRSFGFMLPPFASWSPERSRARQDEARRIIEARMGWDITDYGQGDFDRLGLFLFTLRNGSLADLRRGGGMCHAGKPSKDRGVAQPKGGRIRVFLSWLSVLEIAVGLSYVLHIDIRMV